jgi:hypothetical protein
MNHEIEIIHLEVLRYYATSRKVAVSRPDEVNDFLFNVPNPCGLTGLWGLLSL